MKTAKLNGVAFFVLAWISCGLAAAATALSVVATPANVPAPANVTLSISVNADPEPVTITRVDYFSGETLLGSASSAPFTLAISNIGVGEYSIVAKATVDNPADPELISASTPLIVTSAAPGSSPNVYYIQVDQLNTPREITDQNSALVWKWDGDPFGSMPPEEAPTMASRFAFSLRFSGQIYDNESGLHYNYFRDYDPQTGRYVQSDPIGLRGGINTYGYVGANPLSLTDPKGLNPATAAGAGIGTVIFPGPGTVVGAIIGTGIGIWAGDKIYDAMTAPKAASNFPPGVWPGDKGADEWGRRNKHGAKEGRGRFHGVKQDCPGSKPTDVYGVNPETGDVYDPAGDIVGNLEDAKRK